MKISQNIKICHKKGVSKENIIFMYFFYLFTQTTCPCPSYKMINININALLFLAILPLIITSGRNKIMTKQTIRVIKGQQIVKHIKTASVPVTI